MTRLVSIACIFAYTLAGCASDASGGSAADVTLVEETVLQEDAADRLARPSSIAQAPNGDLFVTDRLLGKIFRFDKGGSLLGSIGRKGSGPGEFEGPRTLVFLGDSLLVGIDPGLRRAQRFTYDGGLVGSSIGLPFTPSMPTSDGATVWFGGTNMEEDRSLYRWVPGDDSITGFLPIPHRIRELPQLLLLGGAVPLLSGDTLLVGFGTGEITVYAHRENKVVRTVEVPVLHRRGLTETTLAAAREGNGQAVLNGASSLNALGRLPSGGVAVAFRDISREGLASNGTVYVSILDRNLSPTCVDLAILQLDDAVPHLTFVGDTLLVFERPLVSADSVRSVVRRFLLPSPDSCGSNRK